MAFDRFVGRTAPIFKSGLPDFSCDNIPKRGKKYEITTKLPNDLVIFYMGMKDTQYFPF
jgi:hypothetical protein